MTSEPSGGTPAAGDTATASGASGTAVQPLPLRTLHETSPAGGGAAAVGQSASDTAFDLLELFKRQFWLIAMCVAAGITAATFYSLNAEVWYTANAKILVSQRNAQATQAGFADGGTEKSFEQDVLDNHIEMVNSSRVLDAALERPGPDGRPLAELPSIASRVEPPMTAADYVREHLSLSKGGEGAASEADSLNIAFEHAEPEDARLVLEAVVGEYQRFLDTQLRSASSKAATLIRETQEGVEQELLAAEEDYVEARTNAPLLFQEGAGNIYIDKFRTLEDELLDVEMQESSVATRLSKVRESLATIEQSEGSDLQKLALIDSESLERLGMFAALQMNAGDSVQFKALQADQTAGARTEYDTLIRLMTEKARLEADFGSEYSGIKTLDEQIAIIRGILDRSDQEIAPLLEASEITPAKLLEAYVGFLEHDLASFAERKIELRKLASEAEKNAKTLIAFELQDGQLRAAIDRKQEMYDGIVEQLRNLDMAANFSGFVHELLDAPRRGEPSWPKLPLCLLAGAMLGAVIGGVLALLSDRSDDRFRSASEVESELGVKVLGRIGKLEGAGQGPDALAAATLSPEGEAFRTMRTVLLPEVRAGRLTKLTLTSPLQGDGKSTTLANLAGSFAQAGVRTLVVDADMRRPTAHLQFGVPLGDGLSDVLMGEIDPASAITASSIKNLSVMSAGHAVSNPAELIQSDAFGELLRRLRAEYELVMIDVGPVLAVSDPIIVGQACDGVLMVTRVSKDTKAQARDAVSRLRAGGAGLLGVVVNSFGADGNFSNADGYYGYYGGYGYGERTTQAASPSRNGVNGRHADRDAARSAGER